jgi:hypothetical protein
VSMPCLSGNVQNWAGGYEELGEATLNRQEPTGVCCSRQMTMAARSSAKYGSPPSQLLLTALVSC